MPIRDYPFIQMLPGGKPSLRTKTSGPKLWVRLENPNARKALLCLAIVDTGASHCAAPADWASALGIDLKSVPAQRTHTAGGENVYHPHRVRISVLGIKPDGTADEAAILQTSHDVPIHFTPRLTVLLLGQTGFLEKFVLTIKYLEHKFSLYIPTDSHHKKTKNQT